MFNKSRSRYADLWFIIPLVIFVLGRYTGSDLIMLVATLSIVVSGITILSRGQMDEKLQPVNRADLFRYLFFLDQPRWLMTLRILLAVLLVVTMILQWYVPALFNLPWVLFILYLALNMVAQRNPQPNTTKTLNVNPDQPNG